MSPLVWKILLIIGLGLPFCGLILMIELKILRTKNCRIFDCYTLFI